MPTAPDSTSVELAVRLGARAELCEVVASTPLGASFHEVVLRGDPAIAGVAGNDVMLRVLDDKGRYVRRRYSVRAVDAERAEITLWIVTSHEGAGATWANTAKPGDLIDVVGPRGKILLDEHADWHLFAGDATGLASFYRMAESVPTPGRAIFIVEVDNMDDALTTSFEGGLGVTGIFVERYGRSYDDPEGLLRGLAAFELPPGVGHGYLFGEFHIMRALQVALVDRGMREDQLHHKAYWRADRHNADHGEPEKDL
jgi:NADPH-dependent ferric siderophore reductase